MKVKTRDAILTGIFSGLMIVGANIKINLPYIPVSLQTFFCVLSGIILGARMGAASQLIYMLLGLVGLPAFTGGGGMTYILKPSFGYIIGFILGAWVIGKLMKKVFRKRNVGINFLVIMAGIIVIYIFGILYLYGIMNFYLGKHITIREAALIGFFPTIAKDIVTGAVAAVISTRIVKILR